MLIILRWLSMAPALEFYFQTLGLATRFPSGFILIFPGHAQGAILYCRCSCWKYGEKNNAGDTYVYADRCL